MEEVGPLLRLRRTHRSALDTPKRALLIFILLSCASIRPSPAAGQAVANPENETGSPAFESISQDGVYGEFNRFCIDSFAHREELREAFGGKLRIIEEGTWRHVSETSACVAWRTSVPAVSWVEYEAASPVPSSEIFAESTPPTERGFFLHLHYLTDLQTGISYRFRLVAVDGDGNRIESTVQRLTPGKMNEAIRIPSDVEGPPYNLNRSHATYLVTEDLFSDTTLFNITADGVTLDLGGHLLVYDNLPGSRDPSADERLFGWYAAQGPCGIRTADRRGRIRILNGRIRQGEGSGASQPAAYNPIFLRRPHSTEIAGVTAEYAGAQVTGIMVDSAYEGIIIHHNVLTDHGTEILDRHRGQDGIYLNSEKPGTEKILCHHNLIKRSRHRGITAASLCAVSANEIYIDSYATNSYGIMYYSSRDPVHHVSLYDNAVFGTGYHPIGIGAGFHAHDVEVHGNLILMQGTEPQERWRGESEVEIRKDSCTR